MSYIRYDDLVISFGEAETLQMTDRNRDGLPDDDVVADGINFAQSLIDDYLRERYTVPLTNPPRNLIGFACDIARYRFYQDQPTQTVQSRYDVACFYLKDVSRGLVLLETVSTNNDEVIAYTRPEKIFTRLNW